MMKTKTLTKRLGAAVAAMTAAVGFAADHGAGGTVTYSGKYTIHTFTNAAEATFTYDGVEPVDILLVGGGGGGGCCRGGGGGGGGVKILNNQSLATGTYTIRIGAGGAGGYWNVDTKAGEQGANGGATSIAFNDETLFSAAGGGYGGTIGVGGNGANGGGGGAPYSTDASSGYTKGDSNAGGTGESGGFSGGSSFSGKTSHWWLWGGGGAGAGGAGSNAWYTADGNCGAGNGGAGVSCSISGTAKRYGGGGGGGSNGRPSSKDSGAGYGAGFGCDGGGNGGMCISSTDVREGDPGVAGTGGGGGGGGGYHTTSHKSGGQGGSGVVIIRYVTNLKTLFPGVEYVGATVQTNGTYVCLSFSESGRIHVRDTRDAEVLIVGGGGGGGAGGGGGGGGGVKYFDALELTADTSYDITVGAGGAGAASNASLHGNNGEASSFVGGTINETAQGGGGGASLPTPQNTDGFIVGADGASGGGGAARHGVAGRTAAGGQGVDGQGYAGGTGLAGGVDVYDSTNTNTYKRTLSSYWWMWGGGGGGAGGIGSNAWFTSFSPARACAGHGGYGVNCAITGEEIGYGGGGGGGSSKRPEDASAGAGYGAGFGQDGGGNGGAGFASSSCQAAVAGADGRGGGGGGGGTYIYTGNIYSGAKGGDGVVIVRLKLPPKGLIIFYH